MTELLAYMPSVLGGIKMTVFVTAASALLALILAFILGLAGISQRLSVRLVSGFIVEVFRGNSLLVLLFWIFFALPVLLDIHIPAVLAGILALGINESGYGAEIVRSAIKTRDEGQNDASIALGFSRVQTVYRILLPQSIGTMIPPLGNCLVDLLKVSSLVSLITIQDLTFRAEVARTSVGHTLIIFSIILVLYYIMSLVAGRFVALLEKKFRVTL